MKLRYENIAPNEVYNYFIKALKNKEGFVKTLKIDGVKKPVFILNKNPFNKKLVLELNTLSIYKLDLFLGRIVNIEKVISSSQSNDSENVDKFKSQMDSVSKKIKETMKKTAIEKMRMKKAMAKPKPMKPKIIKVKPKKPMVRKPMMRKPM